MGYPFAHHIFDYVLRLSVILVRAGLTYTTGPEKYDTEKLSIIPTRAEY